MGRFKIGQTKPPGSGRKRGTLNLRSQALTALLHEAGTDPVLELMKLVPKLPTDRQADIWMALLPYCYPRIAPTTYETLSRPQGSDFSHMSDEELEIEFRRLQDACAEPDKEG
jgi:hypothetical protein